ncbi:MAG: coenzyme F420-0:L-glutamate ligase [Candidatus Levybacteria bacterium]|nr:coenzyme F420-0:L-glutamate ligase [Candidatus Levybacteria bacterium]
MQITAIKTHKITIADTDIFPILDTYFVSLPEKSVVAVTSKIIAITEGRIVKVGEVEKETLIQEEAAYYLPSLENKYNINFTIKNNILAPSAGIDESNGDGNYILWPEDPQDAANSIRSYLQKRFGLQEVGVIITDSKTTPLRWGVTGFALSHSGFAALKSYIGEPDLFDRPFQYEKVNVMDSLAASAALVMGEGREQTPLALIEDIPFVVFQDRNPTPEELKTLHISLDEDLYAPFLKSVQWRKGKSSK